MRLLLASLVACADPEEVPDPVEAKVESLLEEMTIEEKIAEKGGRALLPVNDLFAAGGNDRLGIPAFQMVDGPRGVRAGNATAFPVGMARGATWDPELERKVGEAIGKEARAKGANVILAPVVNVLRHPGWGRAQETYGEDPHHLGVMGVAFVEGAQTQLIASVKHFALNSIENTRFTVNVSVEERTLREVYLPHFEKVVKANVGSVMSAYNKVGGTYCGENAHLLSDILKGEWGFDGFVESDWVLGTRSTVEAANAGLDIEMPLATYFGADLIEAVRTGHVKQATIDASVRRILRKKIAFGLDALPPIGAEVIESDAHRALALEVARRSIVLLENDGVLPLSKEARVVVVGELAKKANLGDEGSSAVNPSSVKTPFEGIAALGNARFVESATLAADADAAIVVVGLTAEDEGEYLPGVSGGDRADLDLSAEDEQLILDVARVQPRTIVVLEGGSAITTGDWIAEVEGLLMAWYPGQEGGTAIGEILFGDVNPSGRLPIVFPAREEDLPPFFIDTDEVTYGYDHGYRHLDRQGTDPAFPFGFGLSYTTFTYESVEASLDGDAIQVTITLTNSGERRGIETVQVYAGAQGSAVTRPIRALAAFTSVELAPGERAVTTLRIPMLDLAYYDGGWVVERVPQRIEAGGSSRGPFVATTIDL